jgi:hypothetical protein
MTMTQMNDIPAFPRPASGSMQYAQKGMTLRDYFAAKALQGMFANPEDGHENYDLNYEDYTKEIARCAYKMADAMMKAREA